MPQGIGMSTRWMSGWGLKFFDYDNDGNLDLMIANGFPDDLVDELSHQVTYKEPLLLFRNDGKNFKNVSALNGPVFEKSFAARGLAIGDFNNDGAVDVLVSVNDGAPVLLRNNSARNSGLPAARWMRKPRTYTGPEHALRAIAEYYRRDLWVDAAMAAIKNSGVDHIDSIYVGCMSGGLFTGQEHIGAIMADYLGQRHIAAARVESACASGGISFRQAFIEVASGMSDIVMAGGVEKMTDLGVNTVSDILGGAGDQGAEGDGTRDRESCAQQWHGATSSQRWNGDDRQCGRGLEGVAGVRHDARAMLTEARARCKRDGAGENRWARP